MKKSKFQFSNPNLISLSYETNPDFDETITESLKLETKTKIVKTHDQNKANVTVSLNIGGMDTGYPFEIKITMSADFMWEDELEQTLVDRLLKTNAPSLIVSYMRPIISNITNNSEYPVFNLPYLNMQDNEVDSEDE